ncbi:MAG: hypothetical protein FJ298_16250 [Planctomycetes bacterium]|nr:hypothetical protein [Planctomycetota bacterium]
MTKEARRAFSGILETAAIGSATLGVHLYWWSELDPKVLDGITAASAGDPTTVWALKEATAWFERATDAARDGNIARLSGYVAEQVAAQHLMQSGHHVAFAEAPNTAGYDLLVDGMPFQVKNTLEAGHVLEHLERYPDIPVIVNAELADQLGTHAGVFVDTALSHEQVLEATNGTLEALDGTDALGFEIPIVTIGVAALKHLPSLASSKIDANAYMSRVRREVLSVGGGGLAGAKIGALLGAILGPPGMVIGGVAGGVIGATGGRAVADSWNFPTLCEARDAIVLELADHARWFAQEALPPKVKVLQGHRERIRKWARDAYRTSGEVPASLLAAFEATAVEAERRASELLSWLKRLVDSSDDNDRANAGWVALRECPLVLCRGREERRRVIEEKLRAYNELRERQR